jgi:hypothetical protein
MTATADLPHPDAVRLIDDAIIQSLRLWEEGKAPFPSDQDYVLIAREILNDMDLLDCTLSIEYLAETLFNAGDDMATIDIAIWLVERMT